jgi:hypothetical protein
MLNLLMAPLPQHASRWIDLNMAPALASSSQSPNGHDWRHEHRVVGGGATSALPSHLVTGIPHDLNPHPFSLVELDHIQRPPPVPEFDFPKFDGENP